MKIYKKYQLLFTISFIYILIFMLFIIYLNNNYYNEYTKLNCIYLFDDMIEIILDNEQLKKIKNKNYIYLNSVKKKYTLLSIEKNIYIKNNIKYHNVILKIKGIKANTKLNISIYNKKEKILKLFYKCWKED